MHRLTATDTPMVRYTRTIFPSYASEYKSDLAKCKNLKQVLINHHFDINSFWNQNPKGAFTKYKNDSNLIKK